MTVSATAHFTHFHLTQRPLLTFSPHGRERDAELTAVMTLPTSLLHQIS